MDIPAALLGDLLRQRVLLVPREGGTASDVREAASAEARVLQEVDRSAGQNAVAKEGMRLLRT